MMTPQLTEQYGHVERVSLARAIFSVRSCANAGFKSKPKTAAAAPPMVVNFRKSRRGGVLLGAPSAGGEGRGGCPRAPFNKIFHPPVRENFSQISRPPHAPVAHSP